MSAAERKGLGRGLNALFGDEEADTPGAVSVTAPPAMQQNQEPKSLDSALANAGGRKLISTAQIVPGKYQPRHIFDEKTIAELAGSIEKHGLIQPILVRPLTNFMYEIIAGERRWRAAQKAQLHEVPVIIREIDDETALEIGLIENLQREDLNAIDESRALKQMIDTFNYSQEDVAEKVGKSRSYVSNMLRLAELAPEVSIMVEKNELSAGHARALLGLEKTTQLTLAKKAAKDHMSVRQVEKLAAGEKGTVSKQKLNTLGKKIAKGSADEKDINTLSLEREVSNVLGMAVSVDMADKQAGTLTINFKTLDQLDDVLHRLSTNPGRFSIRP